MSDLVPKLISGYELNLELDHSYVFNGAEVVELMSTQADDTPIGGGRATYYNLFCKNPRTNGMIQLAKLRSVGYLTQTHEPMYLNSEVATAFKNAGYQCTVAFSRAHFQAVGEQAGDEAFDPTRDDIEYSVTEELAMLRAENLEHFHDPYDGE